MPKFILSVNEIETLLRECCGDPMVSLQRAIEVEGQALYDYRRPQERKRITQAQCELQASEFYVSEINELLDESFDPHVMLSDPDHGPMLNVAPLDYTAIFTHRRKPIVWALCACFAENQSCLAVHRVLKAMHTEWGKALEAGHELG